MGSAGMPIYEMEPPSPEVERVAAREAWEGDLANVPPALRFDPVSLERMWKVDRWCVAVFPWLFVIFLAWALGPQPLDEIARIASSPNFWMRLFIGVVEEL